MSNTYTKLVNQANYRLTKKQIKEAEKRCARIARQKENAAEQKRRCENIFDVIDSLPKIVANPERSY